MSLPLHPVRARGKPKGVHPLLVDALVHHMVQPGRQRRGQPFGVHVRVRVLVSKGARALAGRPIDQNTSVCARVLTVCSSVASNVPIGWPTKRQSACVCDAWHRPCQPTRDSFRWITLPSSRSPRKNGRGGDWTQISIHRLALKFVKKIKSSTSRTTIRACSAR